MNIISQIEAPVSRKNLYRYKYNLTSKYFVIEIAFRGRRRDPGTGGFRRIWASRVAFYRKVDSAL